MRTKKVADSAGRIRSFQTLRILDRRPALIAPAQQSPPHEPDRQQQQPDHNVRQTGKDPDRVTQMPVELLCRRHLLGWNRHRLAPVERDHPRQKALPNAALQAVDTDHTRKMSSHNQIARKLLPAKRRQACRLIVECCTYRERLGLRT